MLDWLLNKIWEFVRKLWESIPESTKDEIIDEIVESFTRILKAYFQSTQSEPENQNEKS